MKNETKSNSTLFNIYVDSKVKDITTTVGTIEAPLYVVDKRLVDILIRKVTFGDLNSIKQDLHKVVDNAKTKEELFKELDEFIYVDVIVNHENFIDGAVKDVAIQIAEQTVPVQTKTYDSREDWK